MKRISTYISPHVYRAMKDAVDAEGTKLWKWVEQAVELRIADYEKRRRKATEFVVPFVEEPPHEVTPVK